MSKRNRSSPTVQPDHGGTAFFIMSGDGQIHPIYSDGRDADGEHYLTIDQAAEKSGRSSSDLRHEWDKYHEAMTAQAEAEGNEAQGDDFRIEDGKPAFYESLAIMNGTAGKWSQRYISVFRILQDAGVALEDYELMPDGMADGVLERELLDSVNKSRELCGQVVLRMLSYADRNDSGSAYHRTPANVPTAPGILPTEFAASFAELVHQVDGDITDTERATIICLRMLERISDMIYHIGMNEGKDESEVEKIHCDAARKNIRIAIDALSGAIAFSVAGFRKGGAA